MTRLRKVLLFCLFLTVTGTLWIKGQTTQTNDIQNTQPLFSTNAKYVQGIGIGYWPTCTNQGATANCPGLTLYLSAGTAMCSQKRIYAGGTLTMPDNATSYVRLDRASNCIPQVFNTQPVDADTGLIIATVITAGGKIIGISDDRTIFNLQSGGGGGGITLQTNGVNNGSQTTLNLANGTGIGITDGGSGTVTIAVTGKTVDGTALIDLFPNNAMKGSFVGAQYYNGTNVTSEIPAFYQGPTPGSCGARAYFPLAGWLRNPTLTTTTNQGDGQIETVKPLANCAFNGIGGTGLSVLPSTAAGSVFSLNGLFRVETLNGLDFNLELAGTAGSQTLGANNQYAVPGMVGMEYLADDQVANGNMWNIIGAFGSMAPLASNTYYSGPGLSRLGATETDFPLVLPVDGTAQYFVGSMTANNQNSTTVVTLRKNLADAAITFTVAAFNNTAPSGQAGAHADLTNTVSFVAGDTVDWKIVQGGVNGGTFVNWMLGYHPTNNTSALVWGSFANKAHGGTNYFSPFGNSDSASEIQNGYTLPRGGTASKLYLYIGTAIGGGQSDVFTIEKNGADTALTCTITSAATGVVACDLAHTVTFAAHDRIALKQALTSGNYPPGTWSMVID